MIDRQCESFLSRYLKHWKLLFCGIVFSGLCLGSLQANAQEKFQQWSDNTGRFKVDAEFVRIEGEQVVLRRLDSREIKIPFDRLSPESLELAKSKGGVSTPKKTSPKGSSNPSLSSPPMKDSEKPSPAANSTSAENTAAATSHPVIKFKDDMEPKEFIDLIMSEMNSDNYVVIWDAMPASKQKQLEDLMVAFANKVDPRSFDMIRKTRNTLIDILRKQQKFILNSSTLQLPSEMISQIEPKYPMLVDLADNVVSKDLFDGKRMQKGDMRGLLDGYFTKLANTSLKMIESLPQDDPIRIQYNQAKGLAMAGTNYKVEKTSSTTAILQMDSADGAPPTPPMKLVKTEGRWLPEDLVNNWDATMAQARAGIDLMKPEQIQQGLSTVLLIANAPLNNLKNAKSQAEFDKVLEELSALAPAGIGPPGLGGAGGPPGLGMPGGFSPPGGFGPPPGLGPPSGLGNPGSPGAPAGTLGSSSPGAGRPGAGRPAGPASAPTGKLKSVSFANYQYELPERFQRDSNAKLGISDDLPIETWAAKNQNGQAKELWIITKVDDPKLLADMGSNQKNALYNSTDAWARKQSNWKLSQVTDLIQKGSGDLPIGMIKTLTMVNSGEVIGFTAGFTDGNQTVIIYCFQFQGDTIKQATELEACLNTFKKK